MRDSLTGRVDLVRGFAVGGAELQEAVARLLGLVAIPPTPSPPDRVEKDTSQAPVLVAEPELPAAAAGSTPFWYARSFASRATFDTRRRSPDSDPTVTRERPEPVATSPFPLATNASVLTKLRRVSAFSRVTGEIDVPQTVDRLGRGQSLSALPRRVRKSWGRSIHLIVNRHRRLAPYWDDQRRVVRLLRRLYPREGMFVAVVEDGDRDPRPCSTDPEAVYRMPEQGIPVVALGDLGSLSLGSGRPTDHWVELGHRYRENGNQPVALVPCDTGDVSEGLARVWTVIPWENPKASRMASLSNGESVRIAEVILDLLSFSLRVEPRMVRAVRRLLIDGGLGAGIEGRIWQSDAFEVLNAQAASFRPDVAERFRHRLEEQPAELRRKVYELVGELRRGSYEGIWFAELLGLEREAQKVGLKCDLEEAGRWFQRRPQYLRSIGAVEDPTVNEAIWFQRIFPRLPHTIFNGKAGDALHAIWALVGSGDDIPPAGLDPARLPVSERAIRVVELGHFADSLLARSTSTTHAKVDDPTRGSLVGSIRARHPLIKVEPWTSIPAWVSDWGKDQFGHWRTFQVKGVTQRLRWMPPGEFSMGSDWLEAGRFFDEGPAHPVRITRGFWLFDTTCTQALWEAVMGDNPSRFRSPTRPVERVSWNDCHTFLERLNTLLKGASFSLPTEAQWEYACRAGTTAATYAGNLKVGGENSAPALNGIAWYSGNCWVDFELNERAEIANSREKQHNLKRRGTHPVGGKAPNRWGLYDMLGNVSEWCLDVYDGLFYGKSPRDDPVAQAEEFGRRVIRGGSWFSARTSCGLLAGTPSVRASGSTT